MILYSLSLPFLAGAAFAADTIHLADGKSIANVQVLSEGLKDVVYKEGKSDRSVPSDTVLAVDFDKQPPQFGEAEQMLLDEDPEGALDVLESFVQAALDKPSSVSAFKWAPAQAAWRALELRQSLADFEGVKGAATRLLQSFGESRFVPLSYLAKAEAELSTGQGAEAQKTLTDLSALVASQSLAKRWALECRLLQARADDKLKPASRRGEYERVMGEAVGLHQLQLMAQVLIGDTYLAEAAANPGAAKDLRAKALAAFEQVIRSNDAGRGAVAAAHVGRGEGLFLLGADADDKARLQEAVLQFLRVATLYRDQGPQVAKSLFYAMRCFDLLPDPRRKAEMKRELLGLYPSTPWAAEAKKY